MQKSNPTVSQVVNKYGSENQKKNSEWEMGDLTLGLCDPRFVREIALLGGEVNKFVSPSVHQRLLDKVKSLPKD